MGADSPDRKLIAAAMGVGVACSCLRLLRSPDEVQEQSSSNALLLEAVRAGEDDEGRPRTLSAPDDIGRMRDSTKLLRQNDFVALRTRLHQDGYLLIRGLLSRSAVVCAREACTAFLAAEGLLRTDAPLDDAAIRAGGSGVLLAKYQDTLVSLPQIRSVLESPRPFFDSLFGEPSDTFPYKWLRAVATSEFTGAHIDSVYMGRGSRRLTTCWIPFGDIPVEQGTLLVCPKGTGANESLP
jgi:hypothetical protein